MYVEMIGWCIELNKNNKELLKMRCESIGRELEIPGIYRHFKLSKDGEDMIYAVSNCSIPKGIAEISDLTEEVESYEVLRFWHTEHEDYIDITRIGDNYYHNKIEEPDFLPIYTALYSDRKTYVRPLSMFLSVTDKDKYPSATQRYRLEHVL